MTFNEWLTIGLQNEWVLKLACANHDVLLTDEELDAIDNDNGDLDPYDMCVPVLRLGNLP